MHSYIQIYITPKIVRMNLRHWHAAACFYHIRSLRQVHCRISQEVTQQLVLVVSPTSTLQPLQCIQNAAARQVFGLSRSDHVTPTLIQLHCLPVSYRIKFKLCCLVHTIEYGCSPEYLMETVQSVGDSRSRSGLRSSSTSSMDYSLPRLRTKSGERAFSHAGLATWNALPDHIRTVADPVKFRKLLKSHSFSQAFNFCRFLCFFQCFSIWLTFVMHLWSRFS